MDAQSIGLLATAISAPITAAILKLVPARGVHYDGPPPEQLLTKQQCLANRDEIVSRLTRVEGRIHAIETSLFPTKIKEPT